METKLPDISKFDQVVELLGKISQQKRGLSALKAKTASLLCDLTIDDLTHVRELVSDLGHDNELDDVLDVLFNRVYQDD